MKNENDLIEIGYCSQPHGIKGGFAFVLHEKEDSLLDAGVELHLFPYNNRSKIPAQGKILKIKNISFGNKVIAYLEGIENRNQAEEILPFTIKVFRKIFPDLDSGEYYVADLLGLDVFEHSSGKKIGIVKDFYENGAQIVFTIKTPEMIFDLPFVSSFFPKVDVENKRVEIVIPEYLDG